ncbi:MAG TPA: phosphoribosylformylglycinamidine cyclo-ligase, partial [Aliiroseovarius sp.]|nr:phosphoribosylformylglycinamidine cyclo-ligase [Aliiroseovarius sp.]
GAQVDLSAWELPPVFKWLTKTAGMEQAELLKTFNAGIGMVLAVSADRADAITELLQAEGETVFRIGQVADGAGVSYTGALL